MCSQGIDPFFCLRCWKNPRSLHLGALFGQTFLLLHNFTFAFCSPVIFLSRISNLALRSNGKYLQHLQLKQSFSRAFLFFFLRKIYYSHHEIGMTVLEMKAEGLLIALTSEEARPIKLKASLAQKHTDIA